MCGIAGYSGIPAYLRRTLTVALGLLIDSRGGHGAGYIALDRRGAYQRHSKTKKTWRESGRGFIGQSISDTVIMHSRYATCAGKSRKHAHPFAVQRDSGSSVIGVHNGMIRNAAEHATSKGRTWDADHVDSFELYRELAHSGDLSSLKGYGALAFADTEHLGVRLVRICDSGELECAQVALPNGNTGLVWGSTETIVQTACSLAGLSIQAWYELDTGIVYQALGGVITATGETLRLGGDGYESKGYTLAGEWGVNLSEEEEAWLDTLNPEERAWYRGYTRSRNGVESYVDTSVSALAKSHASEYGDTPLLDYSLSHVGEPVGELVECEVECIPMCDDVDETWEDNRPDDVPSWLRSA